MVVALIKYFKDSGHPDYQHLQNQKWRLALVCSLPKKGQQEEHGMEPVLPDGILHIFDEAVDRVEDLETDKVATPV